MAYDEAHGQLCSPAGSAHAGANPVPSPVLAWCGLQSWNHEFFWSCMQPGGGGAPPKGSLADAIVRDFGSVEAFKVRVVVACEASGAHRPLANHARAIGVLPTGMWQLWA